MKVLVACEYSATVRDAFRRRGHDAWSCDLLDTEGDPDWHLKMDVLESIRLQQWDLIILHVPCTALAVCGNSTYGVGKLKHIERQRALAWTIQVVRQALLNSPCVALENPASIIFPKLRDDLAATIQYIQPYEFGHLEQKKTGLALWGLPVLRPTHDVYDEMMKLPRHIRERVHFMGPRADRAKERARFYKGFAEAMATQWGSPQGADQWAGDLISRMAA